MDRPNISLRGLLDPIVALFGDQKWYVTVAQIVGGAAIAAFCLWFDIVTKGAP